MGTPQVNLKNHIAINSSWLTLVRPGQVLTLHLKGKKVFSVENDHRLLFGLLLVSRLIYYDILINIFRDCLFSRFALHRQRAQGPLNRTRKKAARTEFEQVWTWWGGWSYIFPCPQILAFERSFQKMSEVFASAGKPIFLLHFCIAFYWKSKYEQDKYSYLTQGQCVLIHT